MQDNINGSDPLVSDLEERMRVLLASHTFAGIQSSARDAVSIIDEEELNSTLARRQLNEDDISIVFIGENLNLFTNDANKSVTALGDDTLAINYRDVGDFAIGIIGDEADNLRLTVKAIDNTTGDEIYARSDILLDSLSSLNFDYIYNPTGTGAPITPIIPEITDGLNGSLEFNTNGFEDQWLELNIGGYSKIDPTEEVTAIITLPSNILVSLDGENILKGVKDDATGNVTYTINENDIPNIQIKPPEDSYGDYDITIKINANDELQFSETTQVIFESTVDGISGDIQLNIPEFWYEDQVLDLNIGGFTGGAAVNEDLEFIIEVPEGVELLVDGLELTLVDGVYIVPESQIGKVQLKPPEYFSGDVSINITPKADGIILENQSISENLTVTPVITGDISITDDQEYNFTEGATSDGFTTFTIDLEHNLVSEDDSEIFTLQLHIADTNIQIEGWNYKGDGIWEKSNITSDDLSQINLLLPNYYNTSGLINIEVYNKIDDNLVSSGMSKIGDFSLDIEADINGSLSIQNVERSYTEDASSYNLDLMPTLALPDTAEQLTISITIQDENIKIDDTKWAQDPENSTIWTIVNPSADDLENINFTVAEHYSLSDAAKIEVHWEFQDGDVTQEGNSDIYINITPENDIVFSSTLDTKYGDTIQENLIYEQGIAINENVGDSSSEIILPSIGNADSDQEITQVVIDFDGSGTVTGVLMHNDVEVAMTDDGNWVINGADFTVGDQIKFKPDGNAKGDFNFSIKVLSQENGEEFENDLSFSGTINAQADGLSQDLVDNEDQALEDTWFPLLSDEYNINEHIIDSDEEIFFKLELPSSLDISLDGGDSILRGEPNEETNIITYMLPLEYISSAQIKPQDENVFGAYTYIITTVIDGDEVSTRETTVNFQAVADGVDLSSFGFANGLNTLEGAEDNYTDLGLNFDVLDESETSQLAFSFEISDGITFKLADGNEVAGPQTITVSAAEVGAVQFKNTTLHESGEYAIKVTPIVNGEPLTTQALDATITIVPQIDNSLTVSVSDVTFEENSSEFVVDLAPAALINDTDSETVTVQIEIADTNLTISNQGWIETPENSGIWQKTDLVNNIADDLKEITIEVRDDGQSTDYSTAGEIDITVSRQLHDSEISSDMETIGEFKFNITPEVDSSLTVDSSDREYQEDSDTPTLNLIGSADDLQLLDGESIIVVKLAIDDPNISIKSGQGWEYDTIDGLWVNNDPTAVSLSDIELEIIEHHSTASDLPANISVTWTMQDGATTKTSNTDFAINIAAVNDVVIEDTLITSEDENGKVTGYTLPEISSTDSSEVIESVTIALTDSDTTITGDLYYNGTLVTDVDDLGNWVIRDYNPENTLEFRPTANAYGNFSLEVTVANYENGEGFADTTRVFDNIKIADPISGNLNYSVSGNEDEWISLNFNSNSYEIATESEVVEFKIEITNDLQIRYSDETSITFQDGYYIVPENMISMVEFKSTVEHASGKYPIEITPIVNGIEFSDMSKGKNIEITEINDAASIDVDDEVEQDNTVQEDDDSIASGKLAVSDVDDAEEIRYYIDSDGSEVSIENRQNKTTVDSEYGTFTLNRDGSWSYELDNDNSYVQGLTSSSEPITDSITVRSKDHTADYDIVITINGKDDGASITGEGKQINEDATTSVTGNLTILDDDDMQDIINKYEGSDGNEYNIADGNGTTVTSSYGTFIVKQDGSWEYILDNDNSTVNTLPLGSELTDVIKVISADGSASHDITVTINGVGSGATITTSHDKITINEDSTAIMQGQQLDIQDIDPNENIITRYEYTNSDGQTISGDIMPGVETSIPTKYGIFTVKQDGTWSYALDNDNEVVQGLIDDDQGPSQRDITQIIDSLTVFSADGTASDQIRAVINGIDDEAEITVIIENEDTEVKEDTDSSASGKLIINDLDAGENVITQYKDSDDAWQDIVEGEETEITSAYGTFTLQQDGTWSYFLNNNEVQGLKEGDELTDTITVKSADGSDSYDIRVRIDGTDDGANIKEDNNYDRTQDYDVEEDVDASASGKLKIEDLDSGENIITKYKDSDDAWQDIVEGAEITSAYGTFTLQQDGTWDYELKNDNTDVQSLAEGNTLTDTITVKSADGSDTHDIKVTINGENDQTVVSEDSSEGQSQDYSVKEDYESNSTASGKLKVENSDISDLHFNNATYDGTYGKLTMQTDGTWSYELDNSLDATQALGGEELDGNTHQATENISVTLSDGTNYIISLQVEGTNDRSFNFSNSTEVTINEDRGEDHLLARDVNVTDIDQGEAKFQENIYTEEVSYGEFTINSRGNWTYLLDPSADGVQELNEGDKIVHKITVYTLDGTPHIITINIEGRNDEATFTGIVTATVGEDYSGTVGGTLRVEDIDSDNTLQAQSDVMGDEGYGTFTINSDGSWHYDLDNNNRDVQNLAEGDTLTDTITVYSADNTSQEITVTINGANDVAVINEDDEYDGTQDYSVKEDKEDNSTASGKLKIDDIDEGENIITQYKVGDSDKQDIVEGVKIISTYGAFTLQQDGTWHYDLDNNNSNVQSLTEVQNLEDAITVYSADGTPKVITVTINGANDVADIDVDNTVDVDSSVKEDDEDNSTASGKLKIDDTDNGESSFEQKIYEGTYGKLTMQTDGTWNYLLDNSLAATQALGGGGIDGINNDEATESITITSKDGTEHTIELTVTGANDSATVRFLSTVESRTIDEDRTSLITRNIRIDDVDTGENKFALGTYESEYGTFEMINEVGTWTYTLDPDAVNHLSEGEFLEHDIIVPSVDGTEHTITIYIEGQNDAATFTGDMSGTVTEVNDDSTVVTATGSLTVTDVDSAEQFIADTYEGDYGSLYIDENGNWTYTLDNNKEALNNLDSGESAIDTIEVKSADDTIVTIEVNVNGVDELPLFPKYSNFGPHEDVVIFSYLQRGSRSSHEVEDLVDVPQLSVAKLSDGNYVHAWVDARTLDIYYQKFNESGSPITEVSTISGPYLSVDVVVSTDSGEFTIAGGYNSSGYKVEENEVVRMSRDDAVNAEGHVGIYEISPDMQIANSIIENDLFEDGLATVSIGVNINSEGNKIYSIAGTHPVNQHIESATFISEDGVGISIVTSNLVVTNGSYSLSMDTESLVFENGDSIVAGISTDGQAVITRVEYGSSGNKQDIYEASNFMGNSGGGTPGAARIDMAILNDSSIASEQQIVVVSEINGQNVKNNSASLDNGNDNNAIVINFPTGSSHINQLTYPSGGIVDDSSIFQMSIAKNADKNYEQPQVIVDDAGNIIVTYVNTTDNKLVYKVIPNDWDGFDLQERVINNDFPADAIMLDIYIKDGELVVGYMDSTGVITNNTNLNYNNPQPPVYTMNPGLGLGAGDDGGGEATDPGDGGGGEATDPGDGDGDGGSVPVSDGDIYTYGGNDTITLVGGAAVSREGVDSAGAGNDTVRTTGQYNTVYAGDGDDNISGYGIIHGDAGEDSITLTGEGSQASIAYGGAGSDTITGSDSNDIIVTGSGQANSSGLSDIVYAGSGDDLIINNSSEDLSYSGAGQSFIRGEEGNDTIITYRNPYDDHASISSSGATYNHDRILGESGDDRLVIYENSGIDNNAGYSEVYGGSGDDDLFILSESGKTGISAENQLFDGGNDSDNYYLEYNGDSSNFGNLYFSDSGIDGNDTLTIWSTNGASDKNDLRFYNLYEYEDAYGNIHYQERDLSFNGNTLSSSSSSSINVGGNTYNKVADIFFDDGKSGHSMFAGGIEHIKFEQFDTSWIDKDGSNGYSGVNYTDTEWQDKYGIDEPPPLA